MKLRYTPQAISDLHMIENYIADELSSPKAAKKLIASIAKTCSNIAAQPLMGLPLANKVQRETSIRYFFSGKHVVFYRLDEATVSIIRVLDTRTDYISIIFPSIL